MKHFWCLGNFLPTTALRPKLGHFPIKSKKWTELLDEIVNIHLKFANWVSKYITKNNIFQKLFMAISAAKILTNFIFMPNAETIKYAMAK